MSANLGFFNEQDRLAFEQIKREFPNKVISQSYLRQKSVITNGQGAYTFTLTSQQGTVSPLPERLLSVTDAFFATRIGFYLAKQIITPTNEPGGFELQSYPNQTYFPAVPGFSPQDLEIFYGGNFSLTINNILIINAASMKRFREVPQTLQSAVNNKSEIDLSTGLIPIVPYPILVGTQTIALQVNVPIFTGMEVASATAGLENQLVAYFEGFLVAQGSGVGQS